MCDAQDAGSAMRDQVPDLAGRATKEEAWAAVESALAAEDSPGATPAQMVRDLREDRR